VSYRITIKHIANEVNLTPATVSRALNNHARISEKTKVLVNNTARQLNYQHNKIASSLRTGKTHTIGVIIPSARINFFGSVVHGIETLANEKGYHTLIYQSEESVQLEIKAIKAFMSARVDGILASLAKEVSDFSHYTQLKKRNVPLVLFDRSNDSLHIPSVVIDDFQGAYTATTHLIEQGYNRIAHLTGPLQFQIFQNRFNGYQAALAAYGIALDETLICNGDISIEAGKKAADYFLQLSDPPDAIFAVEDFSALGLMKRLKEHNVRIPEEMGIIGFANEDFDEHITPALSSIDQQTVNMGREAFKLLIGLIEGDPAGNGSKNKIILDPIPFYRESSMRYGHKKTAGLIMNGRARENLKTKTINIEMNQVFTN
jgi:LacI family transcriptional regulator